MRYAASAVGILGSAVAFHPASADGCAADANERAVVATVAPRGELTLADGRVLRLAGFDPALPTPEAPDLGERARAGLATKVEGKAVKLHLLTPRADRWGRLPAFVIRDGEDTPGGAAAAALADGLGRYLAEPAAHACRAELLQAEARARQAKLGLWADPYYGVLAVEDRAGFAERTGTIVLAEGVVAAVQPSPFRTTLRFAVAKQGSRESHMLVATIQPRVLKIFQAGQMDVARLVGRRVRFRGLLDMRFGPRVELNGPDDVELLYDPGDSARKPPAN